MPLLLLCQIKAVDYYNYERETMTIALSYFDRYYSKTKNIKNEIDPALIALEALYLAAKVHERKKTVFLKDFIYMSGKQYVANDIEVMEIKLLYVLSWYIHPPTPQAFVRHFLHFPPNFISTNTLEDIIRVSYFIIDIAVYQEEFISDKSSNIAHASISIAIDKICNSILTLQEKNLFSNRLKSIEEIMPDYIPSVRYQLENVIEKCHLKNSIRSLITLKSGMKSLTTTSSKFYQLR